MRTLASCLLLAAAAGLSACAATEGAARRDPVRCERDPACARQKGAYSDCTQQCNDNPDCMDRCREAQPDPGLGH